MDKLIYIGFGLMVLSGILLIILGNSRKNEKTEDNLDFDFEHSDERETRQVNKQSTAREVIRDTVEETKSTFVEAVKKPDYSNFRPKMTADDGSCVRCGAHEFELIKATIDWQGALRIILIQTIITVPFTILVLLTANRGEVVIIFAIPIIIINFICGWKALIRLFGNCGKVYKVCKNCGCSEAIKVNINKGI